MSDVGETYLSWLNNAEVNKYLEVRSAGVKDTQELAKYIESVNASDESLMLGIFLKEDELHIGNIKLGPIVTAHKRSEIGFLIGDKSCWGKGYATEAIKAISRYGIEELGLDKITGGCYENNLGSVKALLKAGFKHEATIPSHVVFEGRRIASLLYGLDR